MKISTKIITEEFRQILCDELEKFKLTLVGEMKKGLIQPLIEMQIDDTVIRTSDVCQRWGRSRTTLSKMIRDKKLAPAGKYGRSFTFRTSDIERLFGKSIL